MTFDHDRPYFNMTIAACRRAGSIGGGRSGWSRKRCQPTQESHENIEVHRETARQAIARLDARFPWLCGAERRCAR